MAWTVQVVGIGRRANNEGAQIVTLLFFDDTQKFQKDFPFTRLNRVILEAFARAEVRKLEAEPPVIDLAGISVGMDIDLTPPVIVPPDPPTREEKNLADFFVLRQVRTMQRGLVADGLLDVNAKTVTDTLTALSDALALHPEYGELP